MGATCYMNSILQQFFMIPTFRYNILGIERNKGIEDFDKTPNVMEIYEYDKLVGEKWKTTMVSGDMTLDNPMYHLQKLMSNLECSEKQIYDTEAFCHTYIQ